MERDRASITAFRVALSRAAHQVHDEPRIFDDPVALKIVGERWAAAIRANPRSARRASSLLLRAFVTARSRIAEDLLHEAVARGVRRYLVLGAGLDTFAYRNPYPPDVLRVLEVDHPATQAWKRKLLASAGIPLPESLTFVPVDFETQRLDERLREAGLRDEESVFCAWLGVTMYLTREAFDATVAFLASRAPGSGVLFDYALPYRLLPWPVRIYMYLRARRLAKIDEPWRTFFEPGELLGVLERAGFASARDIPPEETNVRLFADRTDGLRVSGFAHLMSARR
jgi:methyltransferase (TIGR00027 family)